MSQSTGEYRVGLDFNPSGDGRVHEIKRAAADLIDLIQHVPEAVADADQAAEIGELKRLAMRDVESAAMWAVKAATKPLQRD